MLREIVSSLRGSWVVCKLTRHFRAGLSHTAASRLEFGDSIPPVSPGRIQIHLPADEQFAEHSTRGSQAGRPIGTCSLRHLL